MVSGGASPRTTTMNPWDEDLALALYEQGKEDERFQRVMDELDVMASVVEDVEDEEVAGQLTMWIDYMIYRELYDDIVEPDLAPESRECRKLILAHLDQLAWGAAEPTLSVD